jgi:S1-C subfamily serine protease
VPVLHFFTDLHEDYHRPTDDWEKINAVGAAEVAEFVSGVTLALANRPDSLSYVRVPRPQINGQGYGAYLGTIPDMTQSPGGVLLTGVREGSPAQEAGLEGGDIITSIGGTPIANLMDMTKVLRAHQAGDTVEIIARRKEETLHLTAVLGSR